MKKNIILTLLLVVVIGCCFVPFNKDQVININYPFMVVFKQLKPVNWKKWHPQLTSIYAKDSTQIKIGKSNKDFVIDAPGITINGKTNDGFKFVVTKKVNNDESIFSYVAIPQSDAGKCSVIVSAKTNIFNSVQSLFVRKSTDIDALKNYLNNNKAFYGYEITRVKIIHNDILVQKKIVPVAAKITELVKVQQDLHAFMKLHTLKQAHPVMADIRNVSKDSALIMVGIPIIGKVKPKGDFKIMHLPGNGKILSVCYKGPYAGRTTAYKALKAYCFNHSLSSPELPYENFLDNKIPLNDTTVVNMLVNVPVY